MLKKTKSGRPISVTKKQLYTFRDSRGGKMTTRDYEKLKRMELVDSPVRDAIWELKQFSVETLLGVENRLVLAAVGAFFVHFEGEDDTWYHFSLAYIPRALNNRDVNEAIVRMYFVRRWRVTKRSLWAEPEDIDHYGDDSSMHSSHLITIGFESCYVGNGSEFLLTQNGEKL